MIERLQQAFEKEFGHAPRFVVKAPGRVNVLGEHVDYNAGFVLPAAIDRATYVAFSPAPDENTTLLALDFDQRAVFSPQQVAARQPEDWARYPAGVAWALTESGLSAPPMQAVFASDVPRGAGLSSSASVEVAFATAWQTLGGWSLSPMQIAQLSQRAENEYVGVHCGLMDQFASACGVENHLLLLDCRSLDWQTVSLPADVAIVIADTGVRRSLASSGAYNELRAHCEEASLLLGVDALRDISPTEFARNAHRLRPIVAKRAQHVVDEIARVEKSLDLLQAGDMPAFGALVSDCHASLRDLFEVSCPELDVMVKIAQSLPGCYGARLTGAGFGGCTVNLVAEAHAQAFTHALGEAYQQKTGRKAEIYISRASDGAGIV
jgi:galactokinase